MNVDAAPGSGLKLTLKLGSSAPPAVPTPAPAPLPTSSLVQLANSALQHNEMPPPSSATGEAGMGQEDVAAREQDRQAREEKEARGVSAHKYRELKRKFTDAVEHRDDTSLALFRAQKLITRLRHEKGALLDRVLMLESAAGLTTDEVSAAQERETLTERQRDFPLLHPPSLPSLADRPREMPVLTTATDLTQAAYNNPIGPPLPPTSLPPRQQSQHLLSALAAQKLRDNNEARRIARGLPKAPYPAIAVLGLEGSYVAEDVERALSGDTPRALERKAGGGKRKRESTGDRSSSKGKGKAEVVNPVSAGLQYLPNPFAGMGLGDGAMGGRGNPTMIAAQQAAAAALAAGTRPHVEDESRSPGSAMSYDDDEQGGGGSTTAKKHKKAQDSSDKVIKPKRLKTHGITSGTYTIPFIPRNPDGTPELPLPVGIMVLKRLGVITNREHFHTERYIFPVGFECMRKYPSMIDKTQTVEYSCRIADGGDGAPRFEIDPFDQPGVVISAGTPTGAWSQVVKAANRIRERNHSNSVSGPDYYGLAQNVVKALIQELPGARDVPGYIWQTFVEDADPAASAAEEWKKGKKMTGGPRKVTGSKRKVRTDEMTRGEYDDGDEEMGGGPSNQAYDHGLNGYPRSPSILHQSMSPGASSPGYAHSDSFGGSSSLSNLLHHAQPAANPYHLPVALPSSVPAIDPALGSARSPSMVGYSALPYDAYAVPPPLGHATTSLRTPYQSPSLPSGSPILPNHGASWNGGVGSSINPNINPGLDPRFQTAPHNPYAIARPPAVPAFDPIFAQAGYGLPQARSDVFTGYDISSQPGQQPPA